MALASLDPAANRETIELAVCWFATVPYFGTAIISPMGMFMSAARRRQAARIRCHRAVKAVEKRSFEPGSTPPEAAFWAARSFRFCRPKKGTSAAGSMKAGFNKRLPAPSASAARPYLDTRVTASFRVATLSA